MLKISLLFKKLTNFTGKQLENPQDQECEHKQIVFQICIGVPLMKNTTRSGY